MTEGEKKVGESNVVEGAPASANATAESPTSTTTNPQNVHELRQELNEQRDERHVTVEQRREVGKTIVSLITSLKQLRVERDALTKEVQQLKEQRSSLNTAVKNALGAISEHKKIVPPPPKGKNASSEYKNPLALKKQLEQLEYKLETEGLPYEAEKKLMKIINGLRAEFKEARQEGEYWGQHEKLKQDLKNAKREADAVHRILQQKAKTSQEKHLQLLDIAKKVDELRSKENELQEELGKHSQELGVLQEQLGTALEHYAKKKEDRERRRQEQEERKQKNDEEQIEKKKQVVEEKLRSGGKLTTEDILILQSGNDDDEFEDI